MLCHSSAGMSLPQCGQQWPQSLREVLAWHGSPVASLIDPAWVNTARGPCLLVLFCPQKCVCNPSWLTISFKVCVSWGTFLTGPSPGCDGFCFSGVQTWLKQLLAGNLVDLGFSTHIRTAASASTFSPLHITSAKAVCPSSS